MYTRLTMKVMVTGLLLVVLAGCAAQKAVVSLPPEQAQTAPVRKQERNLYESGMFIDDTDGSIYVKFKNYPAINVLDTYFNKKRINYTISAHTLSIFPGSYNMTICENCEKGAQADWKLQKQRRFSGLDELMSFLTNSISKMPLGSTADNGCFPLVCRDDLLDKDAFISKIVKGDNPLSEAIRKDKAVAKILSGKDSMAQEQLMQIILSALNGQIANGNLYADYRTRLPGFQIQLPDKITDRLQAAMTPAAPVKTSGKEDQASENSVAAKTSSLPPVVRIPHVNRYLVEQFFPNDIRRSIRIGYRYTGDGVELYDVNPMYKDPSDLVFKKIFLFSLTAPEAQARLSKLFSLDTLNDTVPSKASKDGDNDSPKETFKNGVIVSLSQQNAMALLAKDDVIHQINQTIFALDAPYDSVMVETKVFEYDDSISRQIGVAMEYARNNTTGQSFNIKTIFGKGIDTLIMPSFGFVSQKSSYDIKEKILSNLVLYANNDAVRITAEPRLVLKPGVKAEVRLLTNKYILTNSSAASSGDLKEVPTGVSFVLTPTILSDKKILLDVELEQSEFIANVETSVVQATNKNTIKTSIIVKDGELFSIGGIKAKRASRGRSGIPWLKDLPWGFGYLFGSEQITNSDVNIEFMIRPTIRFTMERNRDILMDALERDQQTLMKLEIDADRLSKEMQRAVGGERGKR